MYVDERRIVENPWVKKRVKGKKLLDVGCGKSPLDIELASKGYLVWGVDHRNLNRKAKNFYFIQADICKGLPFSDNFFDCIFAISSIEHIGLGWYKDPIHKNGDILAIQEIKRLLSSQGNLLITLPVGLSCSLKKNRVYSQKDLQILLKDFVVVEKDFFQRLPDKVVRCKPETAFNTNHSKGQKAIVCLEMVKKEGIVKVISKVYGFLSFKEGKSLHSLAKSSKFPIVEIGSWEGRSTICLAKGSQEGYKVKVYAVDPFNGGDTTGQAIEWVKRRGGSTYPNFCKNIKKFKVEDIVVPLIGRSVDIAKKFNKKIGVLFIDGAHQYKHVKEDFDNWFPKLVKGGYISFHDSNREGVKKLLDEIKNREDLEYISMEDSITIFRKR